MREIKFRAWDKETNGWLEGVAYTLHTSGRLLTTPPNVELMQYTGLIDKDGKEVYEGDIVEWADVNVRGVVTWMDPGLFYSVVHANAIHGMYNGWMVIGNIYENPELVKHDLQP